MLGRSTYVRGLCPEFHSQPYSMLGTSPTPHPSLTLLATRAAYLHGMLGKHPPYALWLHSMLGKPCVPSPRAGGTHLIR